MMTFDWAGYVAATPEMMLSLWALFILLAGAWARTETAAIQTTEMLVVGMLAVLLLSLPMLSSGVEMAFPRLGTDGMLQHMFIADAMTHYARIWIPVLTVLAVLIGLPFWQKQTQNPPEQMVLIALSVLGMLLMVGAQDILMIYIGLELMSFPLYILAALQRDKLNSAEAGLKYFILGSLASGFMLFGMSLIYGMTGDTSLNILSETLAHGHVDALLIVGFVLWMAGLIFKISAVPFHMWTPDVYHGAPTPITAFMSTVVKFAAFLLLARVLYGPFMALIDLWQPILAGVAVLTMGLGAFLAIVQTNVKRLLAYSSIAHVGFLLVGFVSGTIEGFAAVLFYLGIYGIMTLCAFGALILAQYRGVQMETVDDLAGLHHTSPLLAASFAVSLFSLAGLPPLAGFWAKLFVFQAAVDAGFIWLAIVGVLCSVIAAFYALKIVKTMYFDAGHPQIDTPKWDVPAFVLTILTGMVILFGIQPSFLYEAALAVAL